MSISVQGDEVTKYLKYGLGTSMNRRTNVTELEINIAIDHCDFLFTYSFYFNKQLEK